MPQSKEKIPNSIWAIGVASFLINISSGIVFALSAVYMKTILGVGTGWIGLVEGVVEGCAYLMKLFSGVISDFLRRRKLVMMWGFGLVTLARPILAISTTAMAVFVARLFDRIGNGIQATPRDALVGDISPLAIRGTCYGLRQSMATAGSCLAGLVAMGAMLLTSDDFHAVFWIAAIPAALSFCILAFVVKDPLEADIVSKAVTQEITHQRHPLHLSDIPRLGKAYWLLMIIAGVFMLARVSEAMLILHGHQNFNLSESYTPLVLILYNGANSLASYPIGRLSDRMERRTLLGFGFLVLIIADVLLSLAPNLWVMLAGVAVWGVQIGVTQSMFMALIADTVPEDLRGTGFGFFYLISAVALIFASTIGGFVAQHYGEFMTFMFSAGVGSASLILLIAMNGVLKRKSAK